jgi:hypothetical protein
MGSGLKGSGKYSAEILELKINLRAKPYDSRSLASTGDCLLVLALERDFLRGPNREKAIQGIDSKSPNPFSCSGLREGVMLVLGVRLHGTSS